jgi:hypothetical protein
LRTELYVGGIPEHPVFRQDPVVATDLVLQAYLMLCTLGDPLLAPALDAGEGGLGEIDGHPGRLSAGIGEVPVQERLRACGLGGDLVKAVAPAAE